MDTLLQDVRYAVRSLCRSPAFSLTAVLILGLGIGATTSLFSVLNAVLLRPLPFVQPERLVMLWGQKPDADWDHLPLSYPNFQDVQALSRVFEGIAAWSSFEDSRLALTGAGEPEQLRYGVASTDLFSLLGVRPAAGRLLLPEDEQAGGVLISSALRQRRYADDLSPVGRSITLDGRSHTIVGVLPPAFRFGGAGAVPDVWIPLGQDPAGVGPRSRMYARGAAYLSVVARLRKEVTTEQVRADLAGVARRLAEEHPHFNRDWSLAVVPLREQLLASRRTTLLLLFGAVALVLLIACGNVANLLLVRATRRARELAIREALGAGRLRLASHLLTESVVVALLGGAVGLLLAVWGVGLLGGLGAAAPSLFVPFSLAPEQIGIDARVMGFALLTALLTAMLVGVLPALQGSSARLGSVAMGGERATEGTARGRVRSALVIGQIALSLVLLAGAGLLLRSLGNLLAEDPGFRAERVLVADLSLPAARYAEPERVRLFYDELLARLEALPEVESAGAAQQLPLAGLPQQTDIRIAGRAVPDPSEAPRVHYGSVSPGYFDALGVRLVAGRGLTEQDDARAVPVAVINERMARRFWPGESPIGKRVALSIEALRFVADGPPVLDFESAYRTVVGVVADVRQEGLAAEVQPALYLPATQRPARDMTVVLRSAGDSAALAAALRRTVSAMDAELPVANLRTMQQVVAASTGEVRHRSVLLALFAGVALLLAAVGLYGVLAYLVTLRTREIGIRRALGAPTRDILRLVVREGMGLTAVGIGIGVVAALALTRLLAGMLYGVSSSDPATFGGVVLLLALVALLASYLPARRAVQVDPQIALRAE